MTAAGGEERIPLARPVVGEREEELLIETLRSGQLSLGPRVPQFEQALGHWLGAQRVSAVSSGTAGLHLAIRAAGVQAGDEVVTTPFSFVASANCLLYEDARPIFCDIDPRTLNIDPGAAAAAVGATTTGLLPVHIFGYPADMPALERLAADRGLWLVEDACEALGAVHGDGTAVGARGNLATFGFYPNKQLATGEGGALVSPSAELKERIDSERNQGRARPTWAGSTMTGWGSTTGFRTWPAPSAWLSSSASMTCWPAARGWRRCMARHWPASTVSTFPVPTRGATGAAGSSMWCSCRAARPRRHHRGPA